MSLADIKAARFRYIRLVVVPVDPRPAIDGPWVRDWILLAGPAR